MNREWEDGSCGHFGYFGIVGLGVEWSKWGLFLVFESWMQVGFNLD